MVPFGVKVTDCQLHGVRGERVVTHNLLTVQGSIAESASFNYIFLIGLSKELKQLIHAEWAYRKHSKMLVLTMILFIS